LFDNNATEGLYMLCSKKKLLLGWLNTVFDTCVSFTIFSKTPDPLVAKMARGKLTTQTAVLS